MSILDKSKEGNSHVYNADSSLSLDDLQKWIKEYGMLPMQSDGIGSGRKVVMHTGQRGMDMFQHSMEVQNAVGMLEWLLEEGKITQKEHDNLIPMLQSDDWENFYLAIEFINVRRNGTKIQP